MPPVLLAIHLSSLLRLCPMSPLHNQKTCCSLRLQQHRSKYLTQHQPVEQQDTWCFAMRPPLLRACLLMHALTILGPCLVTGSSHMLEVRHHSTTVAWRLAKNTSTRSLPTR